MAHNKYAVRPANRAGVTALLFAAGLLAAPAAFAQAGAIAFDIPSENTAKALTDFSKQAGIDLLFSYDAAAAFTAPALKGEMTRQQALATLITNTNLVVASDDGKTVVLKVSSKPVSSAAADPSTVVVVTGSHIRNAPPTSPVDIVTQADIQASGYSQVGDVMRALPENFSGGQNPAVVLASTTNPTNQNLTNASTINLRGLGSDATLVLVNSHRLSADTYYQGADIGGVPLAAVQRIEIVTDGASALYGSDAVAGVANIILKRHFDGGEVSARVGAATQGGDTETTYSALEGKAGTDGYLLANLTYSRSDGLEAGSRDFAALAPADQSLIPPQTERSLWFSAGHALGDRVDLNLDALVSDRQSMYTSHYTSTGLMATSSSYVPNFDIAAMADLKLGGDWVLHLTGTAAGSRDQEVASYPAYNFTFGYRYVNGLQSFEAGSDGTLLTLPGGPLKLAVGAGGRHETFEDLPIATTRDVTYAYAEASIPLVGPANARAGLKELSLSLAGRTEHYSDFGSSTNPKIGFHYVPVDGLALRGTLGTSFKAPSFEQMYQQSGVYLYNASTLGYSGSGTAMYLAGGNPNLKPERSKAWTLGGDFSPVHAMTLSATWFDIDYTDRVVGPVANRTAALSDPTYAPFVERNPSVADQAAAIASTQSFVNYSSGTYDPSKVVAIVDDENQNATAQTVRGLDLAYRQTLAIRTGTLRIFGNATWLKLRQQTTVVAPNTTLSGTIGNVPKLKARGGLTWTGGSWSITGLANYVSSEIDTGLAPSRAIASWTTVDATASYELPIGRSVLSGVRLSLAVQNLLDRDPPHAYSPALISPGVRYDSTNSNVLGRFVSLTLAKAW